MSTKRSPFSYLKYSFLLCTMMAIALFLNACGGEEEPVPAEETVVTTPVVETPVIEALPGLEMGEVIPATLSALRFMPESAQIAVALPPLTNLRDIYLPLVQALQPGEDMDEKLAEAIFELGDGIDIQAETIEELAEALGVDSNAPLAAFADYSQTVKSAIAAQEADAAAESADDSESEDSDAEDAEGLDYFTEADEMAFAVVFGITDGEKVRGHLERIASEDETLADIPTITENVDGVDVQIRGEAAYFLTDAHLILGNASLVKDAALRVKNPARIRYGSVECPAADKNEIAMLVYGSRFLPILAEAMPVILNDVDDAALPMIQSQIDTYMGMFAEGEEEDPLVGTLSYANDTVEFLVRADMKANPGLLKVSGPAEPLRLARYLPEHTLALLSFRFNEVFKAQIMEQVLPAAQASGAGDVAMAAQIIPQLGDELTLGITDVKDDEGEIYLMLGLAQPETTKGILQMFLPPGEGVEYKGYMIANLPAPSPVPLYLSFVDDFAVAGTTEAGMKAIIDHHVDKKVSGLFAAMDPPFDIDVPRYQAIHVDSRLLGAPLINFANAFGADTDFAPIAETAMNVFRDIRSSKDLEGDWLKGRVTLHLKELSSITAAMESLEASGEEEAPAATTDSETETTEVAQ